MEEDKKMEEETQSSTSPEVEVEVVKEEVIQITKSDLDEIKDTIKVIKEKNDRLEFAADKARLAQFDSNKEGPKLKTAKISYWNGKPVLGWRLQKDVIEQNMAGILVAHQEMRLYHRSKEDFSDIPYIKFKDLEKKLGDVVKDETDSVSKERILTIKLEDGEEFKISSTFVN